MPYFSNYEPLPDNKSFLLDLKITIKPSGILPERISMPLEVKEWLDAMDITGYELKWHQYERSSVLDSTHSHCIWDTMLVFENPSHAAMFKLAWSTNKQLLNTEGLSGNEFSSSK